MKPVYDGLQKIKLEKPRAKYKAEHEAELIQFYAARRKPVSYTHLDVYKRQAQYVPKNRTIYVRNGMDAGTTLCAIVRECAQADFHKDYTYNRQAYAAPSYCAAYMVAHRYGLDTTAFNFDRVVALYRNLGTEQQRGFLSDVNTVGGGLLRSLSRTLAVQTRELPAAEYAVAVPPAKKPSRQQERG